MTEPSPKPAKRRWRKFLLFLVAGLLVMAATVVVYVHTDSFQSLVRRRLITELERISGGRAEIGSIHTTPFRLQADVGDITVHGGEAAGDVPLAHVDRVVGRLKLSSLLRSELAFHEVTLEGPVVHVTFYSDGTSNIPGKKIGSVTPAAAVERLFALSIDHFDLRHGQILWDDQKFPLDFTARDLSLHADYSFLHRRYDGRLLVGMVDTKLPDCRPFAWMSSVEFSLTSKAAVVPSLKWNSGHSHLSASGQITDFRRPHVEAQYEALFNLGEAAAIERRRDLQGGVLELKGRGEWSLDQFASNGLLALRDLAWRNDQISFSRASLTTGYSVTDQQLKLSKLQGKILQGSFTGDAEWNQWLAPPQHLSAGTRKQLETATISAAPAPGKSSGKTAKPPPVQSALCVVHLRDLSAAELATALNTPAHPLRRFRPAARASGVLEASWKGTPHDAQVQFNLDLNPEPHPSPGQLPLSAHAQGVYDAVTDTLELPQLTLTTPTSRVQASGTLSTTSSVRVQATTTSLSDWIPFLELARGPELFPIALNGSATFSGSMNGSLSSPQVGGTLEVNDFDMTVPATSLTQALETHWDSLSMSVQASMHGVAVHNATLRRSDTSAEFEGSVALQHGHFTGESVFNVRANVHNAELAGLLPVGGYDYPVSGRIDFYVQAAGTLANPHGDGQVHLRDGSAYGESIQQFDSAFRLAQGEISFDHLHLFYGAAVVTGSAAYNPSAGRFRLDLTGNNFELALVPTIQSPRLRVEGRADFLLKASGTKQTPEINASLQVKNLSLNGELSGELDLQAATQGSQLRLTGSSEFQHGSLAIDGNVELQDGYPGRITLQANQLDLDGLWHAYFGGRLTGHSAVTGSVDMSGPLRQPREWTVNGTLTALSLDVDNVKLHQQDPVRFSIARESLKIEQLHLTGEGTDFSAQGSIELAGRRALDLNAQGRADLKLISTFDPHFTSSGLMTMNLSIDGEFSEPLPQGRLQVENGAISYSELPSGLSEINGSLVFSRDHFHIETLTARTGGGTLDLKGDATYRNQQLSFNLAAAAKDVRLRYPAGVSSTADADVHWVGTLAASTVSGDVRINRMAITPGFDFSAYLERSRQLTTVTSANSPLYGVSLDLHVNTAPELQMRTAVARLSGDADLRIRGSVARPAVLGRVDILEGKAIFHGTRFTLERGDITFTNPVAIEPQLNLQASTRVRNYDLNVTLTGTPDRGLNLNYRSEPPLPKSDIIALLALGRSSGEGEQLQPQSGETFADQASAQILNEALNASVSSRWQRLFGASNIKIDPQGLTTETNPISNGPQITIEQEFANHVSLTYSTNVSQSSQQIIQGEYFFNRNVSAVGTRDQNGVVSFDLRVRRREK